MIYVVGDVHGEITKLEKLTGAILLRDSEAEFVFIGDYIDKGEDAAAALRHLTALNKKSKCTFLYGNHEYLWLNLTENDEETINYLLKYGGRCTMDSMQADSVWTARKKMLDAFGDFFKLLQPYWKNEEYIVVHSGIAPEDYETAPENITVSKLLFNRYDFIKQERPYLNQYKVIFGHTGFYYPYVDPYKIGVDTGAYFLPEQPLTAFCTGDKTFIGSDNRVFPLEDNSKQYCPNIPRAKANKKI